MIERLHGALACASLLAFGVFLGGCKDDMAYAEAQAPPTTDPAKLQAGINKLDDVYVGSFGSKYSEQITPSELSVGAALYKGDPSSAVALIAKDRRLYTDAMAATKSCLVDLSKNTVIVNPTDHDTYANFYNAEGDRLNSKAAEYKAFLALEPNASKAEIASVLDLVADARIKEFAAKKLKGETTLSPRA